MVKCTGAWQKCCAINGGISADLPIIYLITLNCIYVTLYFYKNMFNVSIVRIKYARSTIGYSEVGTWTHNTRTRRCSGRT